MAITDMIDGRHALVTGGGSGIGAAIARTLAAGGAEVTICGRQLDRLEAVHGTRIHPQVMDVSNPESVRSATDKAVAARGPISIHVANAGIAEGRRFETMDIEFWRRIMCINLDGAFLGIQESLRSMRERDWGRIIAVSSVAGLRGLKGASAYAASKHGLIGLIRTLSEELMGSGITANAVCPGYVASPILERNVEAFMDRTGCDRATASRHFAKLNRHDRVIEADEVAACVRWLCSATSGSVNGQAIPITGGQP